MGRLALACKMFFRILSDADLAQRVQAVQAAPVPQAIEEKVSAVLAAPPTPQRSEALTLLETFQREARLIDFLNEDLAGYQDAQVGAAVREVHRGCSAVLNRCFEIRPAVVGEEGGAFEVSTFTDLAQVRLVGRVVETRPVSGTLVHAGWRAAKCELPHWSGVESNATLLAPAEVEIS